MRPLDQLAEIAQKAVAIGNELVKSTRPRAVTEKTDRDIYTDVDVGIERKIRSYLADLTPEIGFIGEEEGGPELSLTSGLSWALDPIDGTANYVHGIPLCAVQIALMRHSKPIVAAISLPYLDSHYWAAENLGAYVNGDRITVSDTNRLAKAVVSVGDYATGEGAAGKNKRRIAITAALAENVERIRMFGSAAHDFVWLAEGRTDATVILSNQALDVAGGILIAREAGARVIDSAGQEHSHASVDTIALTPALEAALVEVIRHVQ